MLAQAIEEEVEAWIGQRAHLQDGLGRQQVVRRRYLPKRTLLTEVGPLEVRQPRVRDRLQKTTSHFRRLAEPETTPYRLSAKGEQILSEWGLAGCPPSSR
jgi:hypothetical protein